jgi:7-keto-8-aminopelargonate synthetase-like enzyme
VFSTALPPVIAAAASAAVRWAQSGDGDAARHSLADRIEELALGSRQISPVVVGDDRRAMDCTARLLGAGLFVQGIRPPTVPEGTARLRISVAAAHDREDVERLRAALDELISEGLVPRGTGARQA